MIISGESNLSNRYSNSLVNNNSIHANNQLNKEFKNLFAEDDQISAQEIEMEVDDSDLTKQMQRHNYLSRLSQN